MLSNFLVKTLQYLRNIFFAHEKWKKPPSKVAKTQIDFFP